MANTNFQTSLIPDVRCFFFSISATTHKPIEIMLDIWNTWTTYSYKIKSNINPHIQPKKNKKLTFFAIAPASGFRPLPCRGPRSSVAAGTRRISLRTPRRRARPVVGSSSASPDSVQSERDSTIRRGIPSVSVHFRVLETNDRFSGIQTLEEP